MGSFLDAVLLPRVADEADGNTEDFQCAEVLHALSGMDARIILAVQDQGRRSYRRDMAYR